MSKIRLSLAAAALVATVSASAQTYDLKAGWNLVGSYEDGVSASKFKDANSVWKYGEKADKSIGWMASSPNDSLTTALTSANLNVANMELNAGEGFWVNSADGNGTITNGTIPTDTVINLAGGWQLVSLKNNSTVSVASVFNDTKVATVWKYTDGGWEAYSPDTDLMKTITDAGISKLDTIDPGEGFWVNASDTKDVLATPPSISAAYALVEKNNAIPMANATVFKYNTDGTKTKVSTTNAAGTFDLNTLTDGDKIVVTKSGFAPAYGVVSGGQVQLMSQPMSQMDIPLTAAESDNSKPSSKVLNSGDGTVQIIVNSMTLNQDVTVAVSTFVSPSSAPALNSIENANNTTVTPEEMLIVGGAHITAEDAYGKTLFSVDGTFDANVKQSSILSDLDIILNGQNEIPSDDFVKLAADTKAQLDQAIADDIISLYTLVFKNGVWEYAGTAKIVKYTKMYKEKSYDKYRLETGDGVSLDSLDTFAFVMKMNSLKGELTINVEEGGYKMFDGSIVTKEQSDTTNFNWIDADVTAATVFGDEAVTSPISTTGIDGNVTMSYKVPFVNPYATLSIKKEGYYDTSVTCTMSPNGAECPQVTMYKIPDTSSIEGYVYDNISKEGIDNSLVTLVNPEVLSADKIVSSVDENGTATIEVGYMPNVTYTWIAMKDDANITIKDGNASKSYAMLSEDEIYSIIADEYDDGSAPANYPANPSGTWTLTVKAVHAFTGGKTMTEQAVGSFNLDLNIEKLASKLSGALNEGSQSFYNNLGSLATNGFPVSNYAASVYGGIQTGFMYFTSGGTDNKEWRTYIAALGGDDANGDLKSDDYNDTVTGQPLTCIDDPSQADLGTCTAVVSGEPLIYNDAIFPAGYMVSYVADNFANLLKPDPVTAVDSGGLTNYLASGFTIASQLKLVVKDNDGLFSSDDDKAILGDDLNLTATVNSYIDLKNGVGSVKEMLDVPSINLVGESATAYLRQVITDTEGSYQINMIPTELSGSLKVFAKAEGYKFEDAGLDVKLVDDLATGVISQYDLYLNPIDSELNTTEPTPIATTFSDWTATGLWNKLANPSDINVTGYIATVYGEEISLLGDIDSATTGYLWFGNTSNGTYSEGTSNYSSSAVSGSITSPEMNLTNYAFPTLDFKTWFEVESADVAKGMYDQMEVGFIAKSNATLYSVNGSTVTVKAGEYYKLDLLNPDYEPAVQSSSVPYTSAGVDAEPKWLNITLPIEQLAGQTVQFVFTFNSQDSLYNGYRGWGVDAVTVKESMDDNLENPPTIPNMDDTNTTYTGAKILTKTLR